MDTEKKKLSAEYSEVIKKELRLKLLESAEIITDYRFSTVCLYLDWANGRRRCFSLFGSGASVLI